MVEPIMSETEISTSLSLSREEILKDFEICCLSREVSLLARREVLTGKAKFGIIGDGKEVPLVAMARAFRKGDFRSGYYRDQTFMLALGLCKAEDLFAQLYADTKNDPFSGGRQMNSHFATPLIDETGEWLPHTTHYNVTSDISSTAGQMARGLGIALASKKYRSNKKIKNTTLSNKGNEVSFVTIGDASTSEGVFWETMNAAGVQQVPLAVMIWDDGYGISVPTKYQTTKGCISEALKGLDSDQEQEGINIHVGKGWDYPGLVSLFTSEVENVRSTHKPALFHVKEVTQPQGHSTSGSHERYKSKERLQWEKDFDCLLKMANWMVDENIASQEELDKIRKEAKTKARISRDNAWKAFCEPSEKELAHIKGIYAQLPVDDTIITSLQKELHAQPLLSEILQNARQLFYHLNKIGHDLKDSLKQWINTFQEEKASVYSKYLYAENQRAAIHCPVVHPTFTEASPYKNGYEILNTFFKAIFEKHPETYAFGEDVGHIGGVNQGMAGLQKEFGKERVFDTGIREWTIMGQAIGMAMRGLRPIAEIQYLDYLIYGLQPLTDDLATLRWRSNNQQKAPAIIRTRGHRLEGIWHSGSPMGMIVNSLRGMHVCVPRNMVQAAGMYNTLLQSDDPAIVIECLNGYRLKEQMPDNIGTYTVPLGSPETLQEGNDLTLVTYGSCVRIAEKACDLLAEHDISVELIDVQTLLPFDLEHQIAGSIQKTNRVLFLDEDVPGGGTAYMMQEVLEKQSAYQFLDAAPTTLSAKAYRPPFGSDGDYFNKPSVEDVFEAIYAIMHEAQPDRFLL